MELFKPGRTARIGDRSYTFAEELGRGGSGVVYRVTHGERELAMKVFFPFYEVQQLSLFGISTEAVPDIVRQSMQYQEREYEFLAGLSHPNIVDVHDVGEIVLAQDELKRFADEGIAILADLTALPAMVTQLIDGLPLNRAIEEYEMTADHISHALLRLAQALEYLHATYEYMHTDIKSGNVLVRRGSFEPVLIDFALCKNLNFAQVAPEEQTSLLGDWDLFPKELPSTHRLRQIKEASVGTRQDIRTLAFPWLDLFQFGHLLKRLPPAATDAFSDHETGYLRILSEQLTDWDTVSTWTPTSLVPRVFRLQPKRGVPFGVPELIAPSEADRTLVLPPATGVPLTPWVQQFVETHSFRRLNLINQLSLLQLVYPAADYKRSVHVFFAYNLARQVAIHLYDAPLFRAWFDEESVRQLLAVVLLHDINHFPFLHIFQESRLTGLRDLDLIDLFCDGQATQEAPAGKASLYELLNEIGLGAARFKRLLFERASEQQGSRAEIDSTIASIVNSGVDVDKLSYLFLDSYFTGVPYGAGLDFSTLLKAATLTRVDAMGTPHLAFSERAVQALENVVMTRFWHFRSIYWHHTNRAIMAMILHTVRRLYGREGQRDIRDFVIDTMWSGDVNALRYLDRRHDALFGQRSLVNGLFEDRSRLYKRLYTVRAGMRDELDDQLFAGIRDLDFHSEERFRTQVASGVEDFLSGSEPVDVHTDDVLVDVPRRRIDSGGAVYVVDGRGRVAALDQISEPIRFISTNYDQLAKRARVFVSPHIARAIGRKRRLNEQRAFQAILKTALDETRGRSEVQ